MKALGQFRNSRTVKKQFKAKWEDDKSHGRWALSHVIYPSQGQVNKILLV